MTGCAVKKAIMVAQRGDAEEHRLVHDGAAIQIEVWRRSAVIDVPADTVLDLARSALGAKAQLELPIERPDATPETIATGSAA